LVPDCACARSANDFRDSHVGPGGRRADGLWLLRPAVGSPAGSCIGSGSETGINQALDGPGDEAVLCPGAVFTLALPIRFTARDQQLYTQGRPTDESRAMLRVAAASLTTAIYGLNLSGIVRSGHRTPAPERATATSRPPRSPPSALYR